VTKSATLEAMPTMEAEACAEVFLSCHYRFHGFPRALTSDRGSNWTGRFWKRLCKLTGIEQRLSTAFHPQTDGATKRMNQELLAYLCAFVTYSQLDWPKLLPTAMLALNNHNTSVAGASPFFLSHGYHAEPVQQVESASAKSSPATDAEAFVQQIHEAQEYAQVAIVTV
jgi:transposase InsO family protein